MKPIPVGQVVNIWNRFEDNIRLQLFTFLVLQLDRTNSFLLCGLIAGCKKRKEYDEMTGITVPVLTNELRE